MIEEYLAYYHDILEDDLDLFEWYFPSGVVPHLKQLLMYNERESSDYVMKRISDDVKKDIMWFTDPHHRLYDLLFKKFKWFRVLKKLCGRKVIRWYARHCDVYQYNSEEDITIVDKLLDRPNVMYNNFEFMTKKPIEVCDLHLKINNIDFDLYFYELPLVSNDYDNNAEEHQLVLDKGDDLVIPTCVLNLQAKTFMTQFEEYEVGSSDNEEEYV
uniref:Uncharacterized protein n=1 Tax=Erinnyis ello granulovirus TaxID=307444 RepID=A0A288WHG2_9BBAC|nr:hypothetical protein EREL_011 [Erinnyis ello granulovirus]